MKVPYFHAQARDERERDAKHVPQGGVRWGFPSDVPCRTVDLPTMAIRVAGGNQLRGEIVALGKDAVTFKLSPDSPMFATYGAEAVLWEWSGRIMLDVEPTVVRPTAAWLRTYLDNPRISRQVRADRQEWMQQLEGRWIEVRDVWPDAELAYLVALHRFEHPKYGEITQSAFLDVPVNFRDLEIVSGPQLADRFSFMETMDRIRKQCASEIATHQPTGRPAKCAPSL